MMFFDCCCEIGPRLGKDPAAPWTLDDVVKSMDRCGIAGALVVHTHSVNGDPILARKELRRDLAAHRDRCFPVWILLPPGAGDGELAASRLLRTLDKAGVRAVKFHPRTHGWAFVPAVIGPVLAELERGRILTLLDYEELGVDDASVFSRLDVILQSFPNLPLLLQKIRWTHQRVVMELMQRHRNLHLELSEYQGNRVIEYYARWFGPERLLFGSGLPAMSAGAARTLVDYAALPKAAQALIAGGNLTRLLKGLRPVPSPAVPSDPLRRRAMAGRPLGGRVLDAHCHLLAEGQQSSGTYVMYRGDAAGMLELQDRLGIQTTAVMSWSGPLYGDLVGGNDLVARAVRRHPGRYLGLAYVDPAHLAPADLMRDLRLRVERQGCVGLKPYLRTNLRYTDPLYALCWEYANERGLYALLHMGGGAGPVESVGELAAKYPYAQWVIAHSGGSFAMARSVAAVMRKQSNVWAELTLTAVPEGVIEWLVSEAGDDRILFGTDAPMRDPRPQAGWVVWADLPVATRRRILGENYRRLLALRKM